MRIFSALMAAAIWVIALFPLGVLADEPLSASSASKHRPKAVIVVRPAAWATAIASWKDYRRAQGHAVFELDAELGRDGVQAAIVEMVKAAQRRADGSPNASPIGYVLLVGDADQGTAQPPLLAAWYRRSTAMVKLGGDELLATDNPYGDIDDDDRPDLAVGRIPADTAEQARQVLERSIAYEYQLDYGPWRRDVRIVAGVGGFGALADSAIEMTTSRFLTDRVPAWCNVNMTYASPNSPFCPDPFEFSKTTLQELDAGSQFWVYIGHGHIQHLDSVRVENQQLRILDASQIKFSAAHARPPIALFLACYTGAFDAREDCLSEQMMLSPSGPVAALAATASRDHTGWPHWPTGCSTSVSWPKRLPWAMSSCIPNAACSWTTSQVGKAIGRAIRRVIGIAFGPAVGIVTRPVAPTRRCS